MLTSDGWRPRCDFCGLDISWQQEHFGRGLCRSCRCADIRRPAELVDLVADDTVHPDQMALWTD